MGIAGRTVFHGHVADPAPALAQLDLFAITSDTEQMPLSLLEAMAAGLPVVATDVGDVAQMVSQSNRSYVVPTDDDEFSAALTRLIDDRSAQRQIGQANEKKARENFDEAVMAARYAEVIG